MMFEKGDIVYCTVKGKYVYTKYRTRCMVTDYDSSRVADKRLKVLVVEPGCLTGDSDWWVDEELFCKYKADIV